MSNTEERTARRAIAKAGFRLEKSSARNPKHPSHGGYMLINAYFNVVVLGATDGSPYTATAFDVADFFSEHGPSTEAVEIILEAIKRDENRAKVDGERKYPNPDKFVAGGGDLLDLPLPTGKTLGNSNLEDLNLLATAYAAAGVKPASVFERRIAVGVSEA